MLPRAKRVLLAEDDEDIRELLATALREDGFDVVEFEDGFELLDYLSSALPGDAVLPRPAIIISDIRMPGHSGLEVLERLRDADPDTPVILISAFADREVQREAKRLGAEIVLRKPVDIDELRRLVFSTTGHVAA